MRVAMLLVVSTLFLVLFPIPAFATQVGGEVVKGEAKPDAGVVDEELAPLPKPKPAPLVPKPAPLVPASNPSVDDDLAPLTPLTPLPPRKVEPKKAPTAKPTDTKPKKDPVVEIPVVPLVPEKAASDAPKVEPKKDPPALVIKPPREFQAPPPDVVTKAPPSHTARYIGIGSGIAGVAAIGVGAYFGLQVLDDKSKAERTTSLEEFNALRAGAKGKIQTADILYGVGGGLLATGVVLIVVDSAMNSSPTPAKSVSIAVLPSGGISVAGTW